MGNHILKLKTYTHLWPNICVYIYIYIAPNMCVCVYIYIFGYECMYALSWAACKIASFLIHSFPDSSAAKESTCNAEDPGWIPWVGKIPWRRDRLPTPVFLSFPSDSAGKESACNAGGLGPIPGLEDPLEEGKATHCSILTWRIVYGVKKSWTWLSNFHFPGERNGNPLH